MNNYCRNCGEKLTNQKKCEKCGTEVLTSRVGELDKTLTKKYIWIFFSILIMNCIIRFLSTNEITIFNGYTFEIFYLLNKLLTLSLIIFIIHAKEKLKYSKFFNIVFWLLVIVLVLIMLLILFVVVSCMNLI